MKRARAWRWRSATRVVDGIVQPKNRRALTEVSPDDLVVERERAGRGWRHVLTKDDIHRFVALIPDWSALSRGLRRVRLAAGSYTFGYWKRGLVAVCALPDDRRLSRCFLDFWAQAMFIQLAVASTRDRCAVCHAEVDVFELSREQARAWQLLDVLCHELGHHQDAMTNRSGAPQRGERYALRYAEERFRLLWPAYERAFDL